MTIKTNVQPNFVLLLAPPWTDYELLDSGAGAKLERFGPYRIVRPEQQAFWRPALSNPDWKSADAVFEESDEESRSGWRFRETIEPRWIMEYKNLKFWAEPTPFRHLGVFPEQASHWDWMNERIKSARRPVSVLNLFGYTGLATLAAAEAGASVTHVDSSKKMVKWASENLRLSGLGDRPVRWIIDDAVKFVQREIRRGVRYDGFIIDPPKYGRGPKGELWKLEESLPVLLECCRDLLSENPAFIILTSYAIRASALSLYNSLKEVVAGRDGRIITGELAVVEQSAGRVLSTAIFARWSAGRAA